MSSAPNSPSPETPVEPGQADMAYMREQLFSPQWRPFMASLMLELFGNFDTEEACGFLRQIGARMGAEIRLRKHRNLEELEAGVNEALAALSWGYARLNLSGSEIEIVSPCTCVPPGQVLQCCGAPMKPTIGGSINLGDE